MHHRLKSILIGATVGFLALLVGVLLCHRFCDKGEPSRWGIYAALGASSAVNFATYYIAIYILGKGSSKH